jgi:hypothetical protein
MGMEKEDAILWQIETGRDGYVFSGRRATEGKSSFYPTG